jgi:hypothetical protein
MCEPTTILLVASAAISAVGAGVQYEGQRKQASQAADNTRKEAARAQMDLQRQHDQQQVAVTADMNEAARKALHDAALFDAVAGEYGEGRSTDRARTVGGIQTGEHLATIAANGQTAQSETGLRGHSIGSMANERLASIGGPSLFGTALQIGGAAVGAYTNHLAVEQSKKTRTTQ